MDHVDAGAPIVGKHDITSLRLSTLRGRRRRRNRVQADSSSSRQADETARSGQRGLRRTGNGERMFSIGTSSPEGTLLRNGSLSAPPETAAALNCANAEALSSGGRNPLRVLVVCKRIGGPVVVSRCSCVGSPMTGQMVSRRGIAVLDALPAFRRRGWRQSGPICR